jgi:hypothetical protein
MQTQSKQTGRQLKINQWTQKLGRLLSVLVVIVLAYPLSVSAQTTKPSAGNGFRITPVRQPFVIEKGTSKTFTIGVTNPSDSPLKAHPIVNDFLPSEDESGEPRLILDPDTVLPRNDFKRLVSPLEDFIIPPRQEKRIDVTVSVPTYAEAGGYYGAIRFVPIIPTEEGRNVALTASIGTIVLVTVPGELREQLNLVQLSAAQGGSGRGFIVGGNVSVLARLKNTGNIHVQPFGKVQIQNMFGKTVHEYEFNNTDPRANVLPDSIRKFIDDIPKDKKLLGRYTIKMNLTYTAGGGEIISGTSTFWYFPTAVFYGLLLLLIVIVAVGNLLVYRFRRKRKSHHKK